MRLKLVFSYDGSCFEGSATQPHKNSVQDRLHEALRHLGIFARPLFASRTDKGVHALRAVAQVDCGEHFKDLDFLKNTLNKFAKPHIFIKDVSVLEPDFEVRFRARVREYRYIFKHGAFSPFLANYYHFYPEFDIVRANELLALFKGRHDFRLFCKFSKLDKSTTRTLFEARAYRHKDMSVFHFRANAFLRGQIRMMCAAVLKGLEYRLSEEQIIMQLKGEQSFSRTLAPASGLYLSRIVY